MPNPPDSPEILDDLRARVASLETQMAELRAITDATLPGKGHVRARLIQTSRIQVRDHGSRKCLIELCAQDDGSWITMSDSQERERLFLKVIDGGDWDDISLQIHGVDENGETRVAARIGLNGNNGAVEVHTSTGHPAALMKGLDENGGAVAVTNEDGEAVALLRSREEGGELRLMRAQNERSVFLSANEQGGTLALFEPGRRAGAMLMANHGGGSLMLNHNDESAGCDVKIGANDDTAFVRVQEGASGHCAALSVIPDHAFVEVERDADGKKIKAFSAATTGDSNMVQVMRPDGEDALTLQVSAESASVSGSDPVGTTRFFLTAEADKGALRIGGNTQDESVSVIADEAGHVIIKHADQPVAAMDCKDGDGRVIVFGPKPAQHSAVMRAQANGASLSLAKGSNPDHDNAGENFGDDSWNREGAGQNMAALWINEQGGHGLLSNAAGTPVVRLHSDTRAGRVYVAGETGAPRAGLAVHEDSGQVIVMAVGEEPVALLGEHEGAGQLTLFGADDDPPFTLPDDAMLL